MNNYLPFLQYAAYYAVIQYMHVNYANFSELKYSVSFLDSFDYQILLRNAK